MRIRAPKKKKKKRCHADQERLASAGRFCHTAFVVKPPSGGKKQERGFGFRREESQDGVLLFFNHNGESKAIVCELVGSLTSRFCVLGIEERKKKKARRGSDVWVGRGGEPKLHDLSEVI